MLVGYANVVDDIGETLSPTPLNTQCHGERQIVFKQSDIFAWSSLEREFVFFRHI